MKVFDLSLSCFGELDFAGYLTSCSSFAEQLDSLSLFVSNLFFDVIHDRFGLFASRPWGPAWHCTAF